EIFDALLHHVLRSAGAGRNEDAIAVREPARIDLADAIDEPGRLAAGAGDLRQTQAIGTVAAAQHDDDVHLGHQVFHGFLAILRRVTDIVLLRPNDVRKALA